MTKNFYIVCVFGLLILCGTIVALLSERSPDVNLIKDVSTLEGVWLTDTLQLHISADGDVQMEVIIGPDKFVSFEHKFYATKYVPAYECDYSAIECKFIKSKKSTFSYWLYVSTVNSEPAIWFWNQQVGGNRVLFLTRQLSE
jgi:hypothetical protein